MQYFEVIELGKNEWDVKMVCGCETICHGDTFETALSVVTVFCTYHEKERKAYRDLP